MNQKRQDPLKFFKTTLHVTMGLLYVIVGIMIIKEQWFVNELQPAVAWALGIVAIAYGLFRVYRGYMLRQEE